MRRSRHLRMARLALTPILAAASTSASAFSDQDFCSAARQFATAIERDVGIWVDRTTRNAGVGVFCERRSVEFWHFTFHTLVHLVLHGMPVSTCIA